MTLKQSHMILDAPATSAKRFLLSPETTCVHTYYSCKKVTYSWSAWIPWFLPCAIILSHRRVFSLTSRPWLSLNYAQCPYSNQMLVTGKLCVRLAWANNSLWRQGRGLLLTDRQTGQNDSTTGLHIASFVFAGGGCNNGKTHPVGLHVYFWLQPFSRGAPGKTFCRVPGMGIRAVLRLLLSSVYYTLSLWYEALFRHIIVSAQWKIVTKIIEAIIQHTSVTRENKWGHTTFVPCPFFDHL